MLLFALVVIVDAVRKSVLGVVPEAEWMGVVGLLALVANTVCFIMLYRHRSDDLNMRSTWLCSRNDLVANTSVIVAAVIVATTGTRSEEHTSELQSLMPISYAVFCMKNKKTVHNKTNLIYRPNISLHSRLTKH